MQDVLATYRRKFGDTHPGTIRAMTMLASPLRLLGNKGRADDFARQAAELAAALYGEEHIFTKLYEHNRAITLRGIQRFDSAYQTDEELLPQFREFLGPRHPFTLSSIANRATSLSYMGDHNTAREQSQIAYDLSVAVRGQDNPLTLACACNLGLDLIAVGNEQAGSELADKSVRRLGELLDPSSQVITDLQAGQRYEFDIEPSRI